MRRLRRGRRCGRPHLDRRRRRPWRLEHAGKLAGRRSGRRRLRWRRGRRLEHAGELARRGGRLRRHRRRGEGRTLSVHGHLYGRRFVGRRLLAGRFPGRRCRLGRRSRRHEHTGKLARSCGRCGRWRRRSGKRGDGSGRRLHGGWLQRLKHLSELAGLRRGRRLLWGWSRRRGYRLGGLKHAGKLACGRSRRRGFRYRRRRLRQLGGRRRGLKHAGKLACGRGRRRGFRYRRRRLNRRRGKFGGWRCRLEHAGKLARARGRRGRERRSGRRGRLVGRARLEYRHEIIDGRFGRFRQWRRWRRGMCAAREFRNFPHPDARELLRTRGLVRFLVLDPRRQMLIGRSRRHDEGRPFVLSDFHQVRLRRWRNRPQPGQQGFVFRRPPSTQKVDRHFTSCSRPGAKTLGRSTRDFIDEVVPLRTSHRLPRLSVT